MCERILARIPDLAEAHWLKGVAFFLKQEVEPAIDALRRAVALDPLLVHAWHDLALALAAQGRHEEALSSIRTLLAQPQAGPAELLPMHRLRTRLFFAQDDWAAALAASDQGLAQAPGDGELVALRGNALRRLNRAPEALAAQEALLAVQPDCVPARCEQGWALLALGQPGKALEAFDQALDGDEQPVSAIAGMGVAELQLDMHEAALAAFDQTLAVDPGSFEGQFYRAVTLQAMGRVAEAKAGYAEVLRRWPRCAEAHANLGSLEHDSGNLEVAIDCHRRALDIRPDWPSAHSNLLLTLLYQPSQTPASLAREHAAWGARFGNPAEQYSDWPNDRGTERQLRIGIVSAELYDHPVGRCLIPALETLDRRNFAVICYSVKRRRDPVTERIKMLADGWHDVASIVDLAMAELIRADGIDILIDLSGHTRENRLPVFALKPAPVQASWLGYPFTTGLSAIDYAIMDEVAVRPGEETLFVERVMRLPGNRFCFEPPASNSPVAPPPALRSGSVTFGSFNNVTKVTPDTLHAWSRILAEVPDARLIAKSSALSDPAVVDRLCADMQRRGLDISRIELRGASPWAEMLAAYGDVDVALDPFPFSGGMTSFEALWMGVPVITLPGWQPVSRQTEAQLQAIGRSEWVARDLDDYVRIAVELARDPLRLADMRAEQRETLRTSSLCDKARIGRELGDTLRRMWQAFVDRND